MYPINPANVPTDQAQYAPYFYQAGLHQRYALPSAGDLHGALTGSDRSTSSPSIDALLGDSERIQTVDQVIARGYFSVPAVDDETTAMISDRRQTSWLGLDDVITQVRARYDLYGQNVEQIERSKCAAINAIYQHEAYVGPGSATSKQHYAKHKTIQKLYEQHNQERVDLWRDVTRIRQLIPESVQLYLAAHRKMAILAQHPGEFP